MTHPASTDSAIVVAIDPGRSKCGIAAVQATDPPQTLQSTIVATADLLVELGRLMRRLPPISVLVIGDGTQSRPLHKAISQMFPDVSIAVVDEHGSSQRARRLYLLQNPGSGWKRLLPLGLRTPDRPYDNIVAELLAKEFLSRR